MPQFSFSDAILGLTFLVALYAAGLSTYLAIKESTKERRLIKITAEFWRWSMSSRITIANIGQRPIVIKEASWAVTGHERWKLGMRGQPPRFDTIGEVGDLFPRKLDDAETYIGRRLDGVTPFSKGLLIQVVDSENNRYSNYEWIDYDEKYGIYYSHEKSGWSNWWSRFMGWWWNLRNRKRLTEPAVKPNNPGGETHDDRGLG